MAMTAFPEEAAAAGRRQARMMRVVNVPMRAVLRLPFATPLSANLMLISYTGVKSGKAYRQPVLRAPISCTIQQCCASRRCACYATRNRTR